MIHEKNLAREQKAESKQHTNGLHYLITHQVIHSKRYCFRVYFYVHVKKKGKQKSSQ